MSEWLEVGTHNYVLVTEGSLLNTGLILGSERAMVIDTGCGPRQGREILDAVRRKTSLPLVVVNTHPHYDHFFGNAVFAEDGVAEFWAHENCAREIDQRGDLQRGQVARLEPQMSTREGKNVELVVPNAIVKDQPVLVDLGDQTATLFYLGRGHTDGDLLVGTSTTLYVGDLVEQGAHPSFEDSYPEEWADVLRHISALRHRYEFLIPGHGTPCSDQFVKTMANTMSTAVRQARQSIRDTPNDATKAIPVLPYGPEQSRWFIKRLQENWRSSLSSS
ncbi:glyoxylase-like metal-dependent hydrolase (beta-lactamase superfamily II) [Arthrobacter oryzae]|uniref:MBL fold metallo-hydrolase n=1 Tax=Arthrobacter oryzae TaxID=409290 RepID=UPI00277E3C23|nr:MBL fold metallo-hydrolase [Arthrobacter oryzae]MDP9986462.1 glyoxylase-like metal-dependent hydrolase (beta-lactamase superfamily II) [Arthrobacter oryzae]